MITMADSEAVLVTAAFIIITHINKFLQEECGSGQT